LSTWGERSEARSVKRTRVIEAFPSVGTKMRFLFDYGDEWVFLVELVKRKRGSRRSSFPPVDIGREGPEQYPDPDDEDAD